MSALFTCELNFTRILISSVDGMVNTAGLQPAGGEAVADDAIGDGEAD